MLEENKCADSFIGTLAYMSPDRVRGIPYSFEADMWSLGITMITMVMGKPPFPTNRGPWNLMNAIIQGPQPTLDPESVSLELQSFVHDCLNQSSQDSTCAAKLLNHDFFVSAKIRGVTTPSLLSRPATPACQSQTSAEVIDKIVEAAMSWQLEQYEDETAFKFNTERYDEEEKEKEPSSMTRNLPQYSTQQIAGLASQMLIESSILQERLEILRYLVLISTSNSFLSFYFSRFDAKYAQINALFIEGWSTEGLRRVVWPIKVEGDKVVSTTFSEAFHSEGASYPKSANTIENDETHHILR